MSLGSESSRISLIDLSKLFPFEIDDKLKEEICFGESLIVSCGHYEGVEGEDSFPSEWSCTESSQSGSSSQEVISNSPVEIKESIEEQVEEKDQSEVENDFHFFFFPDCNKPPPVVHSKTSVLIKDGLPTVNSAAGKTDRCACNLDKQGKCECYIKLKCQCGAKTQDECTCAQLQTICMCHDDPRVTCTCKRHNVCVCYPDGIPRVKCTCNEVDKPCVCCPGKFPNPVCVCDEKPTFGYVDALKKIPCECQQVEGIIGPCSCQKDKDGDNVTVDTCVCKVQKSYFLESNEDLKSLPPCNCDVNTRNCKCFDTKICSCGNPDDCKCYIHCDCVKPCICDTSLKREETCECLERKIPECLVCSCPPRKEDRVLKRVRAGKHGYRWCHQVDSRHTFFDYAYGRHDKVDYKVQEHEKLKILGLHSTDEIKEDSTSCEVHGIKAPPYIKKPRKPSLDCCSAVGGISISVETIGEDKDKFLVQVVSHSSREGAKTGSKLVSIVDCNLHTMEENRSEYITKKDTSKERKSYMTICETGYYNKVVRVCGEHKVVKRIYHSFQDAHNFLLEGANVILLRYFGLRRYKGTIKTGTVLMDGTICESIYVCPGVSQAIVNGTPLFVVKIERHIIEPNGVVHQTLTVLTLRGYVVSHEWADSNYVLHLNPLLNIVPEKDLIEAHAPMRERWREDLQLLSDYLDYKSTRTAENARYMSENGGLTNTIRDYLQALLLLRPQDALHFTRHYFDTVLSAMDLPHNEYFDSSSKNVRYYYFED